MVTKKYLFFGVVMLLFGIVTDSFAVLDRITTTVKVGDTPTGIAITPDGRFAYVANNNGDSLVNGSTVSVINTATNTVVRTIEDASFNQPYSITMNAVGSIAYVTNTNTTTISMIDTAANVVTGVITGFDGPSGMAITPDGKKAYVNNYGCAAGVGSGNGTTVRVVDLTTNTIVGAPITVGLAPASLAITPDGSSVCVINYVNGLIGTGTMSIISTATNTVTATVAGFSGPFAIIINADSSYAYVSNFGSNNFDPVGRTVSVVDINKRVIVKNITVGTQPAGLAFSPNGRFVYVTNYNTLYLGAGFTDLTPGIGIVNIIDVVTNTVLPQILLVGSSPDDIAISPDGRTAYVTNYANNSVSVVDIYDKMWLNICTKCG